MTMSWIRSSKGAILGVLLAISLVAVGTAAAVSVSGTAPEPAQTGETVSMNATLQTPFEGAPDEYTLVGETDLQNANWEVEVRNQGRLVERQDTAGQSFTQPLNLSSGATTVQIDVTGTAPELNTFNYTNMSAENYTAMALSQQSGNAVDQQWRAHRYTNDSRDAREAIDSAQAAVEEAGGEAGREDLDRAISAYDSADFDNAVSLAEEAESTAEQSQGGLPLVLIGGVAVVAVLAIGGGVYYWRSQQGSDYKLQ